MDPLLAASTLPMERLTLVHGFDAWVEASQGAFAIGAPNNASEAVPPERRARLAEWASEPWPRWRWQLAGGLTIDQEIFVPHGKTAVFVSWKLIGASAGEVTLLARPFLSLGDRHGSPLCLVPVESCEHIIWHPQPDAPGVIARSNGRYRHDLRSCRNFFGREAAACGVDFAENLTSPGVFRWNLAAKPAVWLFTPEDRRLNHLESTEELYVMMRRAERQRRTAVLPATMPRSRPSLVDESSRRVGRPEMTL